MRGIPRERPDEFGTRQFLTDEEFARRATQDEQTLRQQLRGPYGARNDLRSRTFRQTSLVVDPPDGKIPPLTPEAESRATPRDRGSFGQGPFDGPEDFSLFDRCITRGVVGSILPVIYGNGHYIVQAPGYVAISYEMVHDTRIIPLDGRPHPGGGLRLYLGDARGRWDGNTLVVETTNFTDRTSISENGNGLRHSQRVAPDRAHHAGRPGRARVPRDDRRSEDLHAPLDDGALVDVAARVRAAPLRVPRGESWLAEHPQRRAHRGPRWSRRTRSEGSSVRAACGMSAPARRRRDRNARRICHENDRSQNGHVR